MAKKRKLDEFHAHEALHTTSVVMEIFERHVHMHPFIKQDKELLKSANEIFTSIFNLYQMIGEKNLTGPLDRK
jgi:hypothetical protein